jgi:hypothetical protein
MSLPKLSVVLAANFKDLPSKLDDFLRAELFTFLLTTVTTGLILILIHPPKTMMMN